MDKENQNITLAVLLESLEDDFDAQKRTSILEGLKNSQPKEESLLGAKMLLEANHWDYRVLKKGFDNTAQKIEQIAAKPQKRNSSYLKYAAVVIPITFILGYFINSTLSPKNSIEQFYTKEEGLPNYMGTETNNWEDLMKLYRANKMKEASVVSERILVQKPLNDTAIYFHGVIGYELHRYKLTKIDYLKIIQNKQSVFYYDATFRLGFVLKDLNENRAAQQQFDKIANDSNNPFKEKAKEVLKQF
jgi:hypothetical protein